MILIGNYVRGKDGTILTVQDIQALNGIMLQCGEIITTHKWEDFAENFNPLTDEESILVWLGDRELAVVAVDGKGYTITREEIRTAGLDPVIHGFDSSPPRWLADYIRELLKAPF